jgi:hypothetical protein
MRNKGVGRRRRAMEDVLFKANAMRSSGEGEGIT